MPVIEKIKLATDKNVVDLKADLVKKIADGLAGKADLTYVNEKLAGGTPKAFPELDFYYDETSKDLNISYMENNYSFIIKAIDKHNPSIQSKYSDCDPLVTIPNIYPGSEHLLEIHYFTARGEYFGTNFKFHKVEEETDVTSLDHFTVNTFGSSKILKYVGNDENILVPKISELKKKFGRDTIYALDKLFVMAEPSLPGGGGIAPAPNKTARKISFAYDKSDSWDLCPKWPAGDDSEFINNFPNLKDLDLRNILHKEYDKTPDIFIANCPNLEYVSMSDKTKIFVQEDFSKLGNTKKLVSNCPKLRSGKFLKSFISKFGIISGIDNIPGANEIDLSSICFSKLTDDKITNENFKLLDNSPTTKIWVNRIDADITKKIYTIKNWTSRTFYSPGYPESYPYEEWINIDMKKYLEYLNYKDKKRDGKEWRI